MELSRKSFKEGISSFAWNSLNSNPPKPDRSGRKRKLQLSSLQPDIDAIDSSDSCHSDSSCDVIINKRVCPTATAGHHFTPYAKVRSIWNNNVQHKILAIIKIFLITLVLMFHKVGSC